MMNQEESQNTREKYLMDWQAMLIKQEIDLVEKQTSFKLYEADLFKFEDSLKEVQKEINDEKIGKYVWGRILLLEKCIHVKHFLIYFVNGWKVISEKILNTRFNL